MLVIASIVAMTEEAPAGIWGPSKAELLERIEELEEDVKEANTTAISNMYRVERLEKSLVAVSNATININNQILWLLSFIVAVFVVSNLSRVFLWVKFLYGWGKNRPSIWKAAVVKYWVAFKAVRIGGQPPAPTEEGTPAPEPEPEAVTEPVEESIVIPTPATGTEEELPTEPEAETGVEESRTVKEEDNEVTKVASELNKKLVDPVVTKAASELKSKLGL
ncbi:MAG: hypothetical protein GY861_20170 [bacterium]|nr:hypothetical protein [bacterium]